MDRRESRRNSTSLARFIIESQLLEKLIKLILSIFMFLLFVSRNIYLYRFAFRLVTHGIDKNYIFLFCNGLLAFVIKYSGFISFSSPKSNHNHTSTGNYFTGDCKYFEGYNDPKLVAGQSEASLLAGEVKNGILENETGNNEKEREPKELVEEDDDRLGESMPFASAAREEEEEEEEEVLHEENNCFFNEELEETPEEGNGILTAEELNDRFEEFIRKMREELRIEARRHLIVV